MFPPQQLIPTKTKAPWLLSLSLKLYLWHNEIRVGDDKQLIALKIALTQLG